jgi:hypothetical protein
MICFTCKDDKDEQHFHASSLARKDYTCKDCNVKRGKKNRDKRTAANDYNQKYAYAKNSAKTTKKPFLLTKEQYIEIASKNCYYCDTPSCGLGVGLDRINNDKTIGYTIDNVLPCCKLCNKIRGYILTVEETKVAIQAILEHRKNMV